MDFLFPATTSIVPTSISVGRFQFRCGFSVPCDRRSLHLGHCRSVSIPLWIFCSLRPHRTPTNPHDSHRVSIPLWIFCSLRPDIRPARLAPKGFQFRCGFSVPCDAIEIYANKHVCVFQFRCGFSVPCDLFVRPLNLYSALFQFRCGFSVPCDVRFGSVRGRPGFVSIPLWIFCSLRLHVVDLGDDRLGLFQFRCGFSVPCDCFGSVAALLTITCFNSVVDFLFPATR